MAITSKELAQKLGISAATVSMVLNNKPGISEATRQKVLDAAQKYGYTAPQKPVAATPSQGTICLAIYKRTGAVVSDTPFFSLLTEGISTGCQKNQFGLTICYLYEDSNLNAQLQSIISAHYSGIILLATEMTRESLEIFRQFEAPVLILDAYFETMDLPCVLINNIQGAYVATDYLIHQRNQQPGYLASAYRISNFDERADGYYKAIRAHNLSSSGSIVHYLAPTEKGAYQDMIKLIQSGQPLAKCYFADNDHIAIGAIKAFRDSGFRVPEDIGIVGFDDLPLSAFLDPPLTTIHVPKQYMGESAASKLTEIIRTGDAVATKLEIGTTLKKRKSV